MSEKLKPCPFCGYDLNREPHICCFVNETRRIMPDNVQVHCTGCGARGGSAWNEAEAILKWNRRTPQ